MRITKNNDFIFYYLTNKEHDQLRCNNLEILNGKLINYNTALVEVVGGVYIVNMTKYSSSTSRIQNVILSEIQSLGYEYIIIDDVMINQTVLNQYIN